MYDIGNPYGNFNPNQFYQNTKNNYSLQNSYQLPQNQFQPQQQLQPQILTGINSVDNLEQALMCNIPNNSNALFMDKNTDKFYVVSTDNIGMKSKRIFKFQEINEQELKMNVPQYSDEITNIKLQLSQLQEQLSKYDKMFTDLGYSENGGNENGK